MLTQLRARTGQALLSLVMVGSTFPDMLEAQPVDRSDPAAVYQMLRTAAREYLDESSPGIIKPQFKLSGGTIEYQLGRYDAEEMGLPDDHPLSFALESLIRVEAIRQAARTLPQSSEAVVASELRRIEGLVLEDVYLNVAPADSAFGREDAAVLQSYISSSFSSLGPRLEITLVNMGWEIRRLPLRSLASAGFHVMIRSQPPGGVVKIMGSLSYRLYIAGGLTPAQVPWITVGTVLPLKGTYVYRIERAGTSHIEGRFDVASAASPIYLPTAP